MITFEKKLIKNSTFLRKLFSVERNFQIRFPVKKCVKTFTCLFDADKFYF